MTRVAVAVVVVVVRRRLRENNREYLHFQACVVVGILGDFGGTHFTLRKKRQNQNGDDSRLKLSFPTSLDVSHCLSSESNSVPAGQTRRTACM